MCGKSHDVRRCAHHCAPHALLLYECRPGAATAVTFSLARQSLPLLERDCGANHDEQRNRARHHDVRAPRVRDEAERRIVVPARRGNDDDLPLFALELFHASNFNRRRARRPKLLQ